MKTLKLLFVVVLMGCFTLISSAQPPKTVYCLPVHVDFNLTECIGEILCGDIEWCSITWNNKMQVKIKGSLVGLTSGDTYTINGVGNWMVRPLVNGNAEYKTQVTTLAICLEGIPVATIHTTYHLTYNANGELVAEVENYTEECY